MPVAAPFKQHDLIHLSWKCHSSEFDVYILLPQNSLLSFFWEFIWRENWQAYYILDELLIAGELQESSKKSVARLIAAQVTTYLRWSGHMLLHILHAFTLHYIDIIITPDIYSVMNHYSIFRINYFGYYVALFWVCRIP